MGIFTFMQTDGRSLRRLLEDRKSEIASAHRAGVGGFATCLALSSLLDEAICAAFETLAQPETDHIAIVTLGGFGRRELSPFSDIDVMVLCDSGEFRRRVDDAARAFLHILWDAGVDVGHSVRTIEEAIALHGATFDSWMSMVESRYVCGNASLAARFSGLMRQHIASQSPDWFIEGVLADVKRRHERYGSSVKLLEPNIKKSAGGLRDLQAAMWLFRGTDPEYFTADEPLRCASVIFLDRLHGAGVLDADEHEESLRALEFLLRVRHEMHYRRESLHDTLEYALQGEVAEAIGYVAEGPRRPVEVFMREYYMHARTVYRLLQKLGQSFREAVETPRPTELLGERVGSAFILYEDALSADPLLKGFTNAAQVFEAFSLCAEHEIAPDVHLRGLLERSTDLLHAEDTASEELARHFRHILRSQRVAATLHEMNDCGILPRYIPEFGELVAFFQHNVYHYFTADEHTLIAIANAEALRDRQGILREVFRSLRRKDMLYAALFLHDIGKPRGVADHEVTGVEISRSVLRRLGLEEMVPDVSFLVRNHLVMEQTAFRRNAHDPETLKEFAARFSRAEQLDYLYVLTYADLSALNANVWTNWKAAMLQELYQRTAEVLLRNLSGVQIDEFQQEKHEEAAENVVDALSATMPREQVERHLQGMDSASYIALFSEGEIAEHIARAAEKEPVSALFAHGEGFTEVTIVSRDAPFALSKFCAVLSANDANIFDANIFTRDDGLIIDRFRVSDAATKQHLEERQCAKIVSDLRMVMAGTLDIERLFHDHHKKWKRRVKTPANPTIRTDVCFEDNPRYTIIDVYAPDSVGFLYRVTETISKLGLDIRLAKIATRIDGIVDAFYTLDRSGRPLQDPLLRESVRQGILETIHRLSDEGLGRTT